MTAKGSIFTPGGIRKGNWKMCGMEKLDLSAEYNVINTSCVYIFKTFHSYMIFKAQRDMM